MKKGGNPQNLKPFKKGESGNPNGRPPKLPAIDELLDEVLGKEEDGKPQAKAILEKLLSKAKGGDIRAIEILLDRAYGRSRQAVDLTSKGEAINTPMTDAQVDKLISALRENKGK